MSEPFTLSQKFSRIRIINRVLEIAIYAICLFVFSWPYLPGISFFFQKNFLHSTVVVPVAVDLPDLTVDRLIIPKINVDRRLVEAKTIKTVHEDIWRRPGGSTPDQGSNTVLVAHRYATIGGNRSSTFYNLPSLVMGDSVTVVWHGKIYTYEVFSTDTVLPTQVEIEDPTPDSILTLYTCTPLWTATHRFVVKAKLVSIQ